MSIAIIAVMLFGTAGMLYGTFRDRPLLIIGGSLSAIGALLAFTVVRHYQFNDECAAAGGRVDRTGKPAVCTIMSDNSNPEGPTR